MSKIHIYMNEAMNMIKVHSYIHLYIQPIQLQPIQFASLQQITIQMAEEEIQGMVEQYRAKMEQIAQNQNCLPVRYFQQAEYIIRTEIMQSIKSKDAIPLVEKTLIQWKNQLYSRNQNAIVKWCKELLVESTNSVDKKIGRQIKSFNTFRQQMQMTIQLLRKKLQPYLTVQLSTFIYEFIIQKMLQNTSQLSSIALSQLQDQFKIIQIENKALLVQCKENKRRVAKQDNQSQRTINQLRQTLRNLQNKYDLLQQGNQQLRKEFQANQQNKEEKYLKIAQQSNVELGNLKQLLQKCREECQQAIKKATFLDMQLKKQQLLHKQTMLHYQELVSSYHSKEEELKEQILEVSRVSQKEIDQFKILSTKRLQDWQQTATEFQQQLQQTQQTLKDKEKEISLLRQQLIAEKGKTRLISAELNNQVMELQLKNRVLEQKQGEYQHIRTRFQKGQTEIKKIQKDREHLNQLCKEYQKEKLISQQKYQYLKAQLEQQQGKNNALNELLKKERQQLQRKSEQQKPLTESTFVQTDQAYQQKLKQALLMVRQMQVQYLKLKCSNQRIKRRV